MRPIGAKKLGSENLSVHSLWYPIVPRIFDNHFASARPIASCGDDHVPMRSLTATVPSYAKEAREVVAVPELQVEDGGRRWAANDKGLKL